MRKGLFLSHDGINSSIFESQVLTHVNRMVGRGVELDILAYEVFSDAYQSSYENYKNLSSENISFDFFFKKAFNIYLPFSSILNSVVFLFFCLKNREKYSFIHARTEYTALIALITKPFHKSKVIWDCRGDSIDELKLALLNKNWFVKYILGRYWITANLITLAVVKRFSDSAIFVSEELRKLNCTDNIKRTDIVVPCAVNPRIFYFDRNLRVKTRNYLSYSDQDFVFVYCGSMVQYQGIHLTLDFFKYMLKLYDFVRILIITTQIDLAKDIFNEIDVERILILKVPFSKVNDYYNAADAAVLFRDDLLLNKVASPTKFGEYCMSGLPVVMNNTVEQAVSYGKKIGNYLPSFNFHPKDVSIIDRVSTSKNSVELFARETYDMDYEKVYFG